MPLFIFVLCVCVCETIMYLLVSILQTRRQVDRYDNSNPIPGEYTEYKYLQKTRTFMTMNAESSQ